MPSQNLIYADTEDNIGYTLPGKIPTRAKGTTARSRRPAGTPKYRWTGYIQQDELPYEYDPERGYIVTANQAVVDKDKYPYTLTTDWGYGTRSQRITDLIESKIKGGGKISTDDMRQMQLDNSSEIAKLLVPKLLKIDIADKDVREAQKLLEGWDYTQDADSAAAAYFNAVWRNILKLAFGNKLPKELRVKGQCLWVDPVDTTGPADEDRARCASAVSATPTRRSRTAATAGSRWCASSWTTRTATGGRPRGRRRPPEAATNRDELFERAMIDARWELTAKLGKDIDTWSWGRLHRLFLKNQTLGTEGPGVLQYVLNRGPWKLGGGEATVNATGWNAAGGYGVVWVPSMRMVVNLGDLDKSKWINLTGASGHAYSAHYTDQTDKWAKGELLDWSFSEEAVDEKHERHAGAQAVSRRRRPRDGALHARVEGPFARNGVTAAEAAHPDGVTTACTGRSCGSSGTRATTSESYSSTTRAGSAPARSSRASTRSYEPPPRPRRIPRASTARPGSRTASAPVTASGPRRSPAGSSSAIRPPCHARQGALALVRTPVEVVVGQQDRQQHAYAARAQRVEERERAGLAAHGDVRGHGARVRQLGQLQGPRGQRGRRSRTSSAVNLLLTARTLAATFACQAPPDVHVTHRSAPVLSQYAHMRAN